MNKKFILGNLLILSLAVTTTGCGNQATKTVKSSPRKNSTVTKINKSKSIKSSSSSESKSKLEKIDNKTVGVMISLLAQPSWFKEYINQNQLYYGTNYSGKGEVQGYNYITANGDPTSFVYYKTIGNIITYKIWEPSSTSVAEGHMKTNTVTLYQLENDYYNSQAKKIEIDQYTSKLQAETSYKSKLNNSSSSSESNNTNNNDITAEQFANWALGAFITPDVGGNWEDSDAFFLKTTDSNINLDGISFTYVTTISDKNAGTNEAQIDSDEEVGLGTDKNIYLNNGSGFVKNEKFTSTFMDNFNE